MSNYYQTIKGAHKKRVAAAIAAFVIKVVEFPLLVVAYPHILACRAMRKLESLAMRMAFVEQGMCGGCGKFGTKACKCHVKNPYAKMLKDCYSI